ncbi:competence/damage-inducible protein A [Limosilactobacillus caecicola]|uniref:competence/damage-inducible protein A n=1 Tax=Limosilactobacillus caecicola TaxID=2941332 RepID=UPI0020418045|nr:competence/damage-inducible protein A [Limosilactobacillus caecicola]
MEAEIISVGTEITLGQITNTNARFLADQLRQLNIKDYWQTTVNDDRQRIIAAIHQAAQRAELIFICGGLGPTQDDVTMASVADAVGADLKLDQKYWEQLQADFKQREVALAPENIRQAYYLGGGEALPNPVGLALGSLIQQGAHTYVVLPGPPREFKAMVEKSLLPRLHQLADNQTIASLNLHFVGYPESTLMDDIQEIIGTAGPVVATSYVQPGETQVRLTVFDQQCDTAQQLLKTAEAKIIAQLGKYYYGTGNEITLAGQVVKELKKRDLTVSAAESLTGGLFQATICGVPGASNVFAGGFVTYATEMKTKLLGIPAEKIAQYSVVSGEVAGAMAARSRQLTGAEIGVGFTGVAGPDGLDGHPVGEVWIGVQFGEQIITKQLHLSQRMGRQAIRQQSVQRGLLMLHHLLQSQK